ncbi:formyltetrahydrofolate deformylase [Haloechinothrix alba]|uniref:Formyltetrahydrofolate deformylase n=1 Tax=Haloechinothrix alba TaxID=664784 RepID=A0A238Y4V7_9PSEU|nr:formyltetrahydrofolate deformylase [Haloechinothrix alba]SNR66147.1 formyltetrahydrofolate deformylase [Haloechinothrix alba]
MLAGDAVAEPAARPRAAPHALRPHVAGRVVASGPRRAGVLSTVLACLEPLGATVLECNQRGIDDGSETDALRVEFSGEPSDAWWDRLRRRFGDLAGARGIAWRIVPATEVKRMAVMVSREGHVLQDLLWRCESGDVPAKVSMVISNHADLAGMVRASGIPYHHIPVTANGKRHAEDRQLELLYGAVDFIVLARYMQVLTPKFLEYFPEKIINIHHGLLPAFPGANPYKAAAARGVKVIGATAHYVTEELDAGPIIEQGVCRVSHRHEPGELRRLGRYVERDVLGRAVSWHSEDRVLVTGNHTTVFAD